MTDLLAARREPLRQSRIARFDACPLSLRFDIETDLRQMPGQMGQLAARGALAHRAFAAALNHMRHHKEDLIGVDQMMELLTEVIAQRDVPDDEVVHLSMRELRWLRVLCTKWAYRHTFSIERVVAVERRLNADIEVVGPKGKRYTRTITGQPDVLLAGPGAHEATLLDWKTGWAPPAKRVEKKTDSDDRLSDMGYAQQVVYGWLVLKNYPSIQRVTEREFYVMHDDDPVREASVERSDIERIEDVLASVISRIDGALEGGPESKRWFPIPGTHCAMCVRPKDCPIQGAVGIPTELEEAQRLAREWIVAAAVRTERLPYLKGWVDANGPIPIAHAKGRREVGWFPNKTGDGRSFKLFEPDDAPDSPFDLELETTARERGILEEAA